MAVVWVIATVLQVLAERGLAQAGAVFTGAELEAWVGAQLTDQQRVRATSALCRLQFVKHARDGRVDRYTVTDAGRAAIEEAGEGKQHKSGPRESRKPNPIKPDSLLMRLWHLVRMRGMVDSESAARTLCDAGDPAEFDRARSVISSYLRLWCKAGAVEESARRIGAVGTSNGFKRYVLKPEWKRQAEPPRNHRNRRADA